MPNVPSELILTHGPHCPGSGQYCLIEAWSVCHGLPHTDAPEVAPLIEAFGRGLNDFYDDSKDRTSALSWFLYKPLQREFSALTMKRAYCCVNWALSDLATLLNREGISHGLKTLPQ